VTRPEEDRPVFQGAWTVASALDDISSGGAVRAVDVGQLTLSDVTVTANWFRSAPIDLEGSSSLVEDCSIDVRAVVTSDGPRLAGAGSAIRITGGTTELRRLRVQSDGQPLVVGVDSASTLVLESVGWDGRGDGPDLPESPDAVIDLDAGGQLIAAHVTLVATADLPAIRLGADTEVDVANTIAWGHGDGDGIVVADGAAVSGVGVAFSLFQDPDLDGTDLVVATDPDLRDDLNPRAESPARCAGDPSVASATDLNGDPRPFETGKAPDLGAIERQEPCPSR
jgi:hypothetical protein